MKITTFLKFLVIFAGIDYGIYIDWKTDYSFLTDDDIEEYENVLDMFVQKTEDVIKAIPVNPQKEVFPSESFVQFIKEKEGFFSDTYKCPAKVLTIGYGFTKDGVRDAIRTGFLKDGYTLPNTMSEAEADDFLRNVMIPAYDKLVQMNVHVPLTNNQREALISFTYNLGEDNLKNLANQLNKRDYDITDRMMKYCYAKKKKLSGLAIRRKQEVKMWNNVYLTSN